MHSSLAGRHSGTLALVNACQPVFSPRTTPNVRHTRVYEASSGGGKMGLCYCPGKHVGSRQPGVVNRKKVSTEQPRAKPMGTSHLFQTSSLIQYSYS